MSPSSSLSPFGSSSSALPQHIIVHVVLLICTTCIAGRRRLGRVALRYSVLYEGEEHFILASPSQKITTLSTAERVPLYLCRGLKCFARFTTKVGPWTPLMRSSPVFTVVEGTTVARLAAMTSLIPSVWPNVSWHCNRRPRSTNSLVSFEVRGTVAIKVGHFTLCKPRSFMGLFRANP